MNGGMNAAARIGQRRLQGLPDTPRALQLLLSLEDASRASAAAPIGPASADGVVLYGAGELGQLALAWCRQASVVVHGVVDADAARWRQHAAWHGVAVMNPADVPGAWRERWPLLVCISTLPFAPIERAQRERRWHRVEPFYDFARRWPLPQPMHNGWRAHWPAATGVAALHTVLAGWADDGSRAHHLQFLAWRLARQEWTFDAAPVLPQERFATPEFEAALGRAERLLDGGAHRAQLVQRWGAQHPGRLAQAWLFEPDPDHRRALRLAQPALQAHSSARLQVFAQALGRRSGVRGFAGAQGYGCKLWPHGTARVAVTRLDDLDLAPSVVKLHLEGHEWAALQGGQRTLREHRPALALTVYHRRDGLYAIAAWLMRELPAYRWLFRLHGWLGTGAVVYGIPHERSTR